MMRTRVMVARTLGLLVTLLLSAGAYGQSLPQGLTCGLSYWDYLDGTLQSGSCNGTQTIVFEVRPPSPLYLAAPGYGAVVDGDVAGNPGWVHQELVAGAVYPADSTHFVIPDGAACGFHHTLYSAGHTCMGFNPTGAFSDIHEDGSGMPGCPVGWKAQRAFDMSSGSHYFTWCEYLDPNHLSYGSPSIATSGIACGLSDNDSATNGAYGLCMGYGLRSNVGGDPFCPAMSGSVWIDAGEPSGVGLGFCVPNSPLPPHYQPSCVPTSCPKRFSWDPTTCQCECTLC